jgi:hypothetical protein
MSQNARMAKIEPLVKKMKKERITITERATANPTEVGVPEVVVSSTGVGLAPVAPVAPVVPVVAVPPVGPVAPVVPVAGILAYSLRR